MSTAVELIAKLITQGADKFTSDLEKAKAAAQKLGTEGFQNMQTIGGIAFGAVAAGATAMAGGIAVAVGRAAEFEQAMSKVGAISLASASDLDMLRDAALQAGSTTAFTATQAADGLSFLAMAGFSVEESIEALPAVLAAAAAGNLDLATTADIVSNVLGGLRLDASEAARVSDVLALASSKSNTNIEMLGQTMKFAAPTAANLGYSLEEVTAAAGFLADAGIQSSLAGTHLRAIMGSLATPSKAASDALAGLGVEVRNTDGTMKNMSTIIRDMETALGDVGPAQRDFALNAIFGREAAGSFSILLGRGADALDEYTDALENAGGAAQTMADMQLDNFNGAMTLLKSAIDGAAVAIGSRFLPLLTEMAQKAIPLIEKAMSRLLPMIDGLLSQIDGGMLSQIGKMFEFGYNIIESLAIGITYGINAVTKALQAVGDIITYWLKPGSPPRLLPELDKWGQEAADVYLNGWELADYTPITAMAEKIQGELVKAIESAVASKKQLAEAQDILSRETERFASILGDLRSGLSDIDTELKLLKFSQAEALRPLLDNLAELTDRVNDARRAFEEGMEPLNDELKAIRDRRDEIQRQQKLQEINKKLAEESVDGVDRELLLLEARRLELEAQKKAKEDEFAQSQKGIEAEQAAAKTKIEELKRQQEMEQRIFNDQRVAIERQIIDAERLQTAMLTPLREAVTLAEERYKNTEKDVEAAKLGAEAIRDQFKAAEEGLAKMGGGAGSIGAAIGDAIKAEIEAAIASIDTTAIKLPDYMEEGGFYWAPEIEETAGAFGGLVAAFNAVSEAAQPVLDFFLSAIEPIVTFVKENVQLRDALTAIAIAMAITLGTAIKGLIIAISPLLITFALVTAGVALLRTAWENNWGSIQEKTAAVWDWIKTNVPPAIEAMRLEIMTKLQNIADFWQRHGDRIKLIVSTLVNGIVNFFSGMFRLIKGGFTFWTGVFTRDWEEMKKGLIEIAEGLWQMIETAFNTGWTIISNIVMMLVEEIWDHFNLKDWFALATTVITGLVNGLTAGITEVANAAARIAQAAWDSVSSWWDSRSPSVKFTKLGFTAPEGLVAGILQGIPDVTAAAQKMADVAALNGVLNITPAITPTWGGDTMTGALPFESVNAMQHETRIVVEVRGEHTNTEAHSGAFAGVQAALQQAGLQADIRRRY